MPFKTLLCPSHHCGRDVPASRMRPCSHRQLSYGLSIKRLEPIRPRVGKAPFPESVTWRTEITRPSLLEQHHISPLLQPKQLLLDLHPSQRLRHTPLFLRTRSNIKDPASLLPHLPIIRLELTTLTGNRRPQERSLKCHRVSITTPAILIHIICNPNMERIPGSQLTVNNQRMANNPCTRSHSHLARQTRSKTEPFQTLQSLPCSTPMAGVHPRRAEPHCLPTCARLGRLLGHLDRRP